MKITASKPIRVRPIHRLALILTGVMISMFGVLSLIGGKLQYTNYWGAFVFAPFAILIGGLAIIAGLVRR